MPPEYRPVYDVADELLPHPGYLIVTVMLLLIGAMRLVYQTRRQQGKGSGWLLIALALGFGGVTCLAPLWDVHVLHRAERSGTSPTVEGPIEQHVLRVDTLGGRHPHALTYEGFSVSGVPFGFYRQRDGAGFHNGGRPPLDLHDGQRVRITYLPKYDTAAFPNRILRFEVARSPSAAE